MEILSPFKDGLTLEKDHEGLPLEKDHGHCLSFYYYLGDGAEIEADMTLEDGTIGVWRRKTTDLTGQWLRGEATLYSYGEDFGVSCDLDTGNLGLVLLTAQFLQSLLLTSAICLTQPICMKNSLVTTMYIAPSRKSRSNGLNSKLHESRMISITNV